MTARDALFEAMGWAEDDVQMNLPGFDMPEPAKVSKPSKWNQKNIKSKGILPPPTVTPPTSETPQSELEKHDKKNHPGGYKGGRCKVRGRLAKMGFDVKAYDAKVHSFVAPDDYDYDNAEGDDESSSAEVSTPESKESIEGQILPETETVEVDGDKISTNTELGKEGLEAIQDALKNPNLTEEQRLAIQQVLDKLKQDLQQVKTQTQEPSTESASPTDQPITQENQEESRLKTGPVTDDEYAKIKESADVKAYKEQLRDYLAAGGEIDISNTEDFPPNGVAVRAIDEVLAERDAAGQKIVDVDEQGADILDYEEEPLSPKETPESPDVITPEGQEGEIKTDKPKLTPDEKEYLDQIANKIGQTVEELYNESISSKLSNLWTRLKNFANVRKKWESVPPVEPSRKDTRDGITNELENHVVNESNRQKVSEIDELLKNDSIPEECRDALEILRKRFNDPLLSERETARFNKEFNALKKKHQLDNGKIEVDVESHKIHQNGGVVSSDGLSKEVAKFSQKDGLEITKGKFKNSEKAIEHIQDVLSAQGMSDLPIKMNQGVFTSEIVITLPPEVEDKDANKYIKNIMKSFPGLKMRKDKDAKGNDILVPENVFPVYDMYNSQIKISLHNDNKGNIPHMALLEHPKFKEAVASGDLVSSFALDSTGNPIMVNFRKNPHILFAGTSGAGKNARMDAAITSMMSSKSPSDVQFIFVDGKGGGASFGKYKKSGYSLLPPVGADKAKDRVNFLIDEMRNRDALFTKLGVEDIDGYNRKMAELIKSGSAPEGMPAHLPDMFLAIDEFGNIRNSIGPREFDAIVNQIAQQGRSSGCHLMLATQNPTDQGGLSQTIKTNMSTIVGMRTTNSVGSRSIIDETGLEKLSKGGPLAIKSDDGITYADGSYISPDDIRNSLGAEDAQAIPSLEESIKKLSDSPKEEGLLSKIAERISKDSKRPLNIPADIANKAKQLLESQGFEYTEESLENGRVRISLKGHGNEASTDISVGNQTPTETSNPSGERGSQGGATTSSTGNSNTTTTGLKTSETGGASKPIAGSSPESPNTFIDEAELAKVGKLTRNTLVSNANKLSDLWKQFEKHPEGSEQRAKIGQQIEVLMSVDNQLRSEKGLKIRDDDGNLIDATPQEEGETPEPEKIKEPEVVEPSVQTSKPLSRKDYEAKYPQTREGQLKRINDEREDALDAKWQELSDKGLSPALIRQDKGYQTLIKAFKSEEDEIKEKFPESTSEKSATGQNKQDEQSAISPKDDISGLDAFSKRRYDAALLRFNNEIAVANEGLENGTLDDDEYMEAISTATEKVNKTRKVLGFASPMKVDGTLEDTKVTENTIGAPEAPAQTQGDNTSKDKVDDDEDSPDDGGDNNGRSPDDNGGGDGGGDDDGGVSGSSSGGGGGGILPSDGGGEPTKTSVNPEDMAPKNRDVSNRNTPKFDTPTEALVSGTSKYSPEERKAMSSDPTLQSLQANLVKAQGEHGEDSQEAKNASRMLESARAEFVKELRNPPKHVNTENISSENNDKSEDTEIENNPNIKALKETVSKAKTKAAKEKAQKQLKNAETKLKEALRQASTPESGVIDIRSNGRGGASRKRNNQKSQVEQPELTINTGDIKKESKSTTQTPKPQPIEPSSDTIKEEKPRQEKDDNPLPQQRSKDDVEYPKSSTVNTESKKASKVNYKGAIEKVKQELSQDNELQRLNAEVGQAAMNLRNSKRGKERLSLQKKYEDALTALDNHKASVINKTIKNLGTEYGDVKQFKDVANIYANNRNGKINQQDLNAASDIINAVANKDAKYLKSVLATFAQNGQKGIVYPDDGGSRQAFETITGIKLPEPEKSKGDFKVSDMQDMSTQQYVKRMGKWVDNFCNTGNSLSDGKTQPSKKTEQGSNADSGKPNKNVKLAPPKDESSGSPNAKSAPGDNVSSEIQANRERVEAEKKAKEDEVAKKAAERAALMERIRQQGQRPSDNSRGLNSQSQRFAEIAMQNTDPSKSKGFQIASGLKPPTSISNESANEINAQLSQVSREIENLQAEIKANEENRTLSPKEIQKKVGLIGHLRRALRNVTDNHMLGNGNFQYKRMIDASGNITGLSITSYKDKDGNMVSVKPIEKKENKESGKQAQNGNKVPDKKTTHKSSSQAPQPSKKTIRKNPFNQDLSFGGSKIEGDNSTKDEAIAESESKSIDTVWDEIYDAALTSLG